jgi:cell wall-associated NlpC family hydrolase
LTRVTTPPPFVRDAFSRLPSLPRSIEPALLLSIATVIIGVALVLIRTSHSPEPRYDSRYLASAETSLQAFGLPPLPQPAPQVKTAPRAQYVRVLIPSSPVSRSEGVERVLATARSLVGRPYRWGASGPDAFDCSGLTSYVWRAAGLSLPHSSQAQLGSLPRVEVSELQPGDLVFSRWEGQSHVGLYIGNGMMISAPQTGRRVEVSSIRRNLIGAVRPALLLREDTIEAQAG